jgi:hypothetical protein
MGRTTVSGQMGQKSLRDPSQRKRKLDMLECAIPVMTGSINKRIIVQEGLGKKRDSISKIIRAKKDWGYGSSAHMPASKHNALNSNSSSEKKKSSLKIPCRI